MTKHPVTITATYRIVTPMFCAGADQQRAELRLPSFKGALRFWWRSLMWKKVKDHHELREREAALFGASDGRFGQSKVHMHLKTKDLEAGIARGDRIGRGDQPGISYLGYGVMNFRGELQRPAISGGSFSVVFRFSKLATDEQINEVCNALRLLGTVGGMGSKSRKGFGSLTLTELAINDVPEPLPITAAERLKPLLAQLSDEFPVWTAWSSKSRIVSTDHASGTRAIEVLDALGREQVHFRSWGRNDDVLGKASEQNFRVDHDLSKSLPTDNDYPYRVAFGLPHNYGKGVQKQVMPTNHDRRASAMFFHVHQITADSPPHGVIAFLPADFLPTNDQLQVFGRNVHVSTNDAFWFPVHGFLDRLTSIDSAPITRPGYSSFSNNNWWRKQTALKAQEVTLG